MNIDELRQAGFSDEEISGQLTPKLRSAGFSDDEIGSYLGGKVAGPVVPEPRAGLAGRGAKYMGRQLLGAGEATLALGTGMGLYLPSKAYGTAALPFGAETARIAEEEMAGLAYQPVTEEGRAATELVGKGFHYGLAPIRGISKLIAEEHPEVEPYAQVPGVAGFAAKLLAGKYPRLAYLTELGLELGAFKGAHVVGKGARARLRGPQPGEPGWTTPKGRAEAARKGLEVEKLEELRREPTRIDLLREAERGLERRVGPGEIPGGAPEIARAMREAEAFREGALVPRGERALVRVGPEPEYIPEAEIAPRGLLPPPEGRGPGFEFREPVIRRREPPYRAVEEPAEYPPIYERRGKVVARRPPTAEELRADEVRAAEMAMKRREPAKPPVTIEKETPQAKVEHEVKQHVDAAIAADKAGRVKIAEKATEKAKANAERVKLANGPEIEKLVNEQLGRLPEKTKAEIAPTAPKPVAKAKEPWKSDINLEPRAYQEKYPEKTVHEDWDKANSPRFDLEAAGDIIREFQKKHTDAGYITEKLNRITRLVDNEISGKLHPDDSIGAAQKYAKDKLDRLISQYESQPVNNEGQKLAKAAILDVMKRNFESASQGYATIRKNLQILSAGKPVPAKVLAEYPELKVKPVKPKVEVPTGMIPVYRGVGKRGAAELRVSETGELGRGTYFYSRPQDAAAYASKGGGIITGYVPKDKARILRGKKGPFGAPAADVIVIDDISLLDKRGFIPTTKTIDLQALDALAAEQLAKPPRAPEVEVRAANLLVAEKTLKRYQDTAQQLATDIYKAQKQGKKWRGEIELPESPVPKTSRISEAQGWLDVLVQDKIPELAKQVARFEKPKRPPTETLDQAKTRIKDALKDQRGSFSMKQKEGPAIYGDLLTVGKHIINQGHTKFSQFSKQFKATMGDTWTKVRNISARVFREAKRIVASERGVVTVKGKRDIYQRNREQQGDTFIQKAVKEVKGVVSDVGKMADEFLGPISTRLGNINPALKGHLRKFEMRRGIKTSERTRTVEPLLEKVKAMSKEDQIDFDLARKNGDAWKLRQLIVKYKMGKEYSATRKLLDEMYRNAKEVGYDLEYRKHYHPRVLKDSKGFLKYFYEKADWPIFERAIRAKEVELGRYLEVEEKAQLINSMLRGYGPERIKLAKPGQLKAREIKTIWPEINKFYMSSDGALLRYINSVTDAIEARKAFGVKRKPKGGEKEVDINDTIGDYVLRLLNEGKIKPEHEQVLKEIYTARFNEVGTSGVVGLYKNLSYIDTMGSPISAITQIGDLAWALYKAGIIETTKAAGRGLVGKSKLTKEDIGIERIAQEFADTSKAAKAVTTVFKLIGFEKIDNIGKEALINSTILKAQKQARNPKKIDALRKELEPIFEGETEALIADFKEGRITENVKLHAFNTLTDFQPVTLSEMPQKYLTGGNGRIFYMLKTFTIKQFDAFRREAFQKIKTPGTRIEGMKNLVRLAACFVAANASADVIKSLVLNRPIKIDDLTVDNLLRLIGISKFVTWRARMEGVGAAMVRQIAPPFKFADALSKDIFKAGDEKGLETISSIPIIGKLYYWWLGKGAKKSERRRQRGVTSRTRRRRTRPTRPRRTR